jgi:hypothetical protein
MESFASNILTQKNLPGTGHGHVGWKKGKENKEMNSSLLSNRVTLILLLAVLFLWPVNSSSATLGDLRVSIIEGDVQIKTSDTEDWVPAAINTPIMEGDILWVPEGGKAAIQMRDGSLIRLNERSSLEILVLDDKSCQFYLTTGHAYVNFKAWRGSLLQMDTAMASLRTYEASIFRIDAVDNGLTQISVFKGRVDTESQGGKTTIPSGNTLLLGSNNYAELSPLGPPDEWERWNKEKDKKLLASTTSSRYLPDELRPYSNDFDDNGRWVFVREYGYVWRPTVVVSSGWAPYRVGRWVWVRGDYVWISYEPWGWCPYHYGRWAFVVSFGWCWVPPLRGDVYWGPGFVGWVSTPAYVSWVPLAPREIYYGHGHYGRYSRNITNVNITTINVDKVVYRNVRVKDSVTIVHHDTFVEGKPRDVHVKENPFMANKIHIGQPNIRPEKTTVMPVIKEIPPKERPPERIKEIHAKDLKETRPLIREPNASVLNPHSPPKALEVKTRELKPEEKPRGEVQPEKKADRPVTSKKEMESPKEVNPPERRVEKPVESKPIGKAIEKPREVSPAERGIEKTKESSPPDRGAVEKSKEVKPVQREMAGSRASSPSEKGIENPRVNGSAEKTIEKPRNGRSGEKGMEPPKEMGSGGRRLD